MKQPDKKYQTIEERLKRGLRICKGHQFKITYWDEYGMCQKCGGFTDIYKSTKPGEVLKYEGAEEIEFTTVDGGKVKRKVERWGIR